MDERVDIVVDGGFPTRETHFGNERAEQIAAIRCSTRSWGKGTNVC